MKKLQLFFILFLGAGLMSFQGSNPIQSIEIGTMAPNLSQELKSIDGKTYNLRQLGDNNGLLVIFSCNTCPFVIAWEDRYNELYDYCEANKIGMVLVNSNEAKRGGDDSMERMIKHAKKENYKAQYVIDEKSELANAFGAKSTPHVFLFNNQFRLAYKGAIDDNHKDKDAVGKTYLMDALKSQTAAEEIATKETKALGCSIKRVIN